MLNQVLIHYSDLPSRTNKKLFTPWQGPFSIDTVYVSDCYVVRKLSGTLTRVHELRIKHYDPLNHPTDPSVQLSRDTDHDVAATDEVVSTDNNVPGDVVQSTEATVAYVAVLSSWIGVLFSHLAWEDAKRPPFNAFHCS